MLEKIPAKIFKSYRWEKVSRRNKGYWKYNSNLKNQRIRLREEFKNGRGRIMFQAQADHLGYYPSEVLKNYINLSSESKKKATKARAEYHKRNKIIPIKRINDHCGVLTMEDFQKL